MTFNPHTAEDRLAMLEVAGADSVSDFFAPIPDAVRFPTLDLPPVLTEVEALDKLSSLAAANTVARGEDVYLGAGSYRHFVPAAVGQILSRGEFYTAYTPYQPEVAQGTLQVIYEFQSLVAALTGMDVANASMYDGATALAEGALMTVSLPKKKRRVVVAGTVHPAYRGVLRTYLEGLDVEVVEAPLPESGFVSSAEALAPYLEDDLACIVVQYPNFYGGIEDIQAFADLAHERGGALVVGTYPVPLALLKPPGELGADVVAAEGQALGVAQSYGGPYVGLLATRQGYVRQMPGRLAGLTTDSNGNRGYVLTLQTREQHIRREKATSNICTNQGLMATAATVYMSALGPEGFREVAERAYQNAHYLANEIARIPGYRIATDGEFFHEFVVETPIPASEVLQALLAQGIVGGLDLAEVDDSLASYLLVCTTELNSRSGIERMVAALPRPGTS
ncbi:MAG: aminomethyl-transferring glycine dehydrogenase subunit GcvPA [Thermomicrobiales bacterium]|nr:aminomethyl-transferring glycine dehydrogenase subunit GcvPA [Thermomicrobiales bacterium]